MRIDSTGMTATLARYSAEQRKSAESKGNSPATESPSPVEQATAIGAATPEVEAAARVNDASESTASTADPGDNPIVYDSAARIAAANTNAQDVAVADAAASEAEQQAINIDAAASAAQDSAVGSVAAADQADPASNANNPRVEALRVLVEKLTGRRMRLIKPSSLVAVGHTDEAQAAARLERKRSAAAADRIQAEQERREEALRVKVDAKVNGDDGSSKSIEAQVSITRRFVDTQGVTPGAIKDGKLADPIDVQVQGSASEVDDTPIAATVDAPTGSRVHVVASTASGESTEVDFRSDPSATTTYAPSAPANNEPVAVRARA